MIMYDQRLRMMFAVKFADSVVANAGPDSSGKMT
jgi:hypothetical protein